MFPVPEYVKVIILSIVQGIGEFLPISSSGHLVVIESFLIGPNERADSELSIVLHFGTLLSILLYYRRRIWALLLADRHVILTLIYATLPAVFAGLIIKKKFKFIIESPLLAGFMLPLTGFMLLGLQRMKAGELEYQKLPAWKAVVVGLAQAFAILPGISRSGSTIVMGVWLGMRREAAATFSFLMAIPVIGGAMLLEVIDSGGFTMPWQLALLGIGLSFVVGYFSLSVLVRLLDSGKLHWFAYWLIPFGLAIVVWQLNLMVQAELQR